MDCLKVLRSTAANENESDTFNSYFHQLKKECKPGDPSSRRRDFWELLKKEKLSLITSDEAVDSNVSREAADKVCYLIQRGRNRCADGRFFPSS